jgi:hypothetical protein
MVEVFQVPLVSHAATKMNLRLWQNDWKSRMNATTEFTIFNPAPRRRPHGDASPFPLTNTVGDLTVSLLDLARLSSPGADVLPAGQNRFKYQTRAHFQILQKGIPTAKWGVAGATVLDEEGNAYAPSVISSPQLSNTLSVFGRFSAKEPRIFRFEVVKPSAADAEESATLTNVALNFGLASGMSPSPLVLQLHGFKLEMKQLSQNNNFEQVNLWYEITPRPLGFQHHVLLKGRDANGKEVIVLDHNGGDSAGANMGMGRSYSFSIEPRAVDVVFTLAKSQFVEFLARPEAVATNSTAGK